MARCSRTTTGKDNKASHKTVLKWVKEFEKKFDCNCDKDVIRLRCILCTKWGKRICSIKTFHIIIEQHSLKRIALNLFVRATQKSCQSRTEKQTWSYSIHGVRH